MMMKRFFSYLLSLSLMSTSVVNAGFQDEIPDVETSMQMADLADLVYDVHSQDSNNIPSGYELIFFQETDYEDTEAVIVTHENRLIVSFRGTEGGADVMTDLEAVLTRFGPSGEIIEAGYVHQGFNDAVFDENITDNIESTIKSALDDNPSLELYFTGHSLGGALATLCATYLATKMDNDMTVINFGSPRVGDEDFKNWARSLTNVAIWRFVNDNDAVPRLPALRMWHPGHLIQLEDDQAYLFYQQTGDEDLGYAGVWGSWNRRAVVTDHWMDNYVSYISVKSVVEPETYYVDHFAQDGEYTHVEDQKYTKIRQELEAKSIRGKAEKMSGEAMA